MRIFNAKAALAAIAMFTLSACATSGPTAKQLDIVDTAAAAGSFNTLLAAAEAAGLVDTLKSDGPFTVFAPTDDAFAALPEGTVEICLSPVTRTSWPVSSPTT